MKFGLNVEDVVRMNKAIGGTLLNKNSLEFAIASGKEKSDRRKLALLWRAILIDHPFSDANKRTVEIMTRHYARLKNYKIDTERLVKEIVTAADENISDLKNIERRIKYAVTGN